MIPTLLTTKLKQTQRKRDAGCEAIHAFVLLNRWIKVTFPTTPTVTLDRNFV